MAVTQAKKAPRDGERGAAMVEATIGIIMLLGVMLMVLQLILVFHATLAAHSAATRAARAYALEGPGGMASATAMYNAQKATGLGSLVWEPPVCNYTSTLVTCTARVRVPSIMPGAGTMFGGGGLSGPVVVAETGQYPVIDTGG